MFFAISGSKSVIFVKTKALYSLISFQMKMERPHLSFSYRFRPSTLQRRICLKTLLDPKCVWSNELDACAFRYIGPRNWREIEATW